MGAEILADMAVAAVGVKLLAVEGDNAGGFLTAVLQGVWAERRQRAGVNPSKHAENRAFLVKMVIALGAHIRLGCH